MNRLSRLNVVGGFLSVLPLLGLVLTIQPSCAQDSELPTPEEALVLSAPGGYALGDSSLLLSEAGSRRRPLGRQQEEEPKVEEPTPPESEAPVQEPPVRETPPRERRSLLPTPRRDRDAEEPETLTVPPVEEEAPSRTEILRRRFELPPVGGEEVWERPHDPNTPDFVTMSDRWGIEPPDYEIIDKPLHPLDPYHQSKLKGDYPFYGDDLFTVLTMQNISVYELREIPIPAPPSANDPNSPDFFGDDDQRFFKNTALLSFDVYKGQTSFRPPDWRFRSTFAFDYNDLSAEENQVVAPDPRKGTNRTRTDFALQEMFLEILLEDCIPSYDFTSVRFGIQPFNSDFRGFIYNDMNLGYRLFGSRDNNRVQWNIALFDQLEKDINSELNTTTLRDQRVLIANLYRQDFIWLGYTTQLSFHANWDDGDTRFDENGFLARPDPIGSFQPHDIDAYYLGWAGDGHIGIYNINHAFYQVFGRDSLNPIAGKSQDIDAQLAAFEVSIDRDWIRPKLSFLWASGDNNPTDGKAEGFDAILEKTNFAGAPFSYWGRQALRFNGSAVGLVQRESLYPDLTSSKFMGQSNFVNPGLLVFNSGIDFEWTPKLKTLLNASYLCFDDTEALELALQQPNIGHGIGWDLSLGMEYRPYFTNNVIMKGGVATLIPGSGFKDVSTDDQLYSAFLELILTF